MTTEKMIIEVLESMEGCVVAYVNYDSNYVVVWNGSDTFREFDVSENECTEYNAYTHYGVRDREQAKQVAIDHKLEQDELEESEESKGDVA